MSDANDDRLRRTAENAGQRRKLHNALKEVEWLAQNEPTKKRKAILKAAKEERKKKKIEGYRS